MKMKPTTVGAFVLSLGLAVSATTLSAQAGGMADTRLLVSNCFNCHGTNGVSAGVIDGLDELSSKRMTKAMMQFKSGAKAATIMNRIAKGYSDAEIAAIAKYIAAANGNK